MASNLIFHERSCILLLIFCISCSGDQSKSLFSSIYCAQYLFLVFSMQSFMFSQRGPHLAKLFEVFHWGQVHRCLKEVYSFENLLILCQHIPWKNCFLLNQNLSLFHQFFRGSLPKQYLETILIKKGSKEIVARLPSHFFIPFPRKLQILLLSPPLHQQSLYFWKRSYWYCEAVAVTDRVNSFLPFFCDSSSSFSSSFSPLKLLLSCQPTLEAEEIWSYHQMRQTEGEHRRYVSSRKTSQERSKRDLGFFIRGKEKWQNFKVLVANWRYNDS